MTAQIKTRDECSSCMAKPYPAHLSVGAPCHRIDCHYGTVVRILSLGRRCAEISRNDTGNKFTVYGFVGEALSREYGCKKYATIENAERSARKWLEKHA